MVTHRVVKQAIYAVSVGLFALLFLAFLVISAIQISPQRTAMPTPVVAYEPIAVEQVDFVPHPHAVDAVARLRNPNVQAGVPTLPVKFLFENAKGEVMTEASVTTYILPGSLQYAVALQVPVTENVARVRAELPATVTYATIKNAVDLPSFGSFVRDRRSRVIAGMPIEEQVGIVTNNSTFDFAHVDITTLALDNQGKLVGVGQTFAGELKVGERREFTVQWPQPTAPTQRIIISPTTNSFRSDNIVKIIGDPSLLR